MRRRALLLAAGALGLAPLLHAQQPSKLARIGVLAGAGDNLPGDFQPRAAHLGWIEGKNLAVDWRTTVKSEEIPALAADIVRQNPHVVDTGGPQVTQAMMNAAGAIPIVFIAVGDPVKLGFVKSLTHPRRQRHRVSDRRRSGTAGQAVEKLKEAAPRISRVGILIAAETMPCTSVSPNAPGSSPETSA